MNEIRCTCGVLLGEVHKPNCPMMTGRLVPAEMWPVPAEIAELTSPEPVLARVLRERCEDRKVVQAHLIDGSVLIGIVTEVSEDGTVGTIDSQSEEFWTFDVGAVCVLQTRRSKVAKE